MRNRYGYEEMNIPFWALMALTVATACQITDTFRHGSIFATIRARIEDRGPFLAEWIGCGFCFSHTAGFIAVSLAAGHIYATQQGYVMDPCLFALIWLATTKGSNLLNDVTKSWSRTPGSDLDPEPMELNDDDPLGENDASSGNV